MKRSKPQLAEATISEERGIRYLHLGTPWVQGAMRISKPTKLELDYIQRMMAWLLLRDPQDLVDTRCLQLGLGRSHHQVLPQRVAFAHPAVEINPAVIGCAASGSTCLKMMTD